MKTKANQCSTLREYREEVLRIPQEKVAALAGCKQGWISKVERGYLPHRKWKWEPLLKAYRLTAEQFEVLVLGTIREKAMTTPVAEAFPLAQFQQSGGAEVIGLDETVRKAVEGSIEAQSALREKLRKQA